jgi:Protein of unknown function (DUF3631)
MCCCGESLRSLPTLEGEEDYGVLALTHVRDIFNAGAHIFMFSQPLVNELNDIDDAPWSEWRGRPLTPHGLAKLLRPFGIWPRSIFPPGGRQVRGGSRKGYRRDQFIEAWAAYCQPAGTPAHGGKIKRLGSV